MTDARGSFSHRGDGEGVPRSWTTPGIVAQTVSESHRLFFEADGFGEGSGPRCVSGLGAIETDEGIADRRVPHDDEAANERVKDRHPPCAAAAFRVPAGALDLRVTVLDLTRWVGEARLHAGRRQ